MPIRFRCAYCNQLLGISRRKSGTVVRCPTCAGQVIVPNVETESGDKGSDAGDRLIFERTDFEELLNPQEQAAGTLRRQDGVLTESDAPVALPSPAAPLPGAWGTHAEPAYDVEKLRPVPVAPIGPAPVPDATHSHEIRLSRTRAIILFILVLVLLAAAFAAGLAVALYFRTPSQTQAKVEPARLPATSVCDAAACSSPYFGSTGPAAASQASRPPCKA